jgi:hypothetical protein
MFGYHIEPSCASSLFRLGGSIFKDYVRSSRYVFSHSSTSLLIVSVQASLGRISFTIDTWSDQRLQPYLAITAHWIADVNETSSLQLKSALIGFHRIRRNHKGKTLARATLHLLDRAGITVKVSRVYSCTMLAYDIFIESGHFTFDGASNNGSMMEAFEILLAERDIDFDAIDRSVICFGHTVELCSKRVIRVASRVVSDSNDAGGDDDTDDDDDNDDNEGSDESDDEGNDSLSDFRVPSNTPSSSTGPVPKGRAVVRVIRASGLRRDAFDEVIVNGNEKGWFKQGQPPKPITVSRLQLLRDVQTRWDSIYAMLRRLRLLRPVRPQVLFKLYLLKLI